MGIMFGDWLESGKLSWYYKGILLALLKAKWDDVSRFLQTRAELQALLPLLNTYAARSGGSAFKKIH